jgi:subtilase family serine protease
MISKSLQKLSAWAMLLAAAAPVGAAQRQRLHDPVSDVVAQLTPTGRLPATQRLSLVIGLPLHHREQLTNLLQQLYDPASPNFHRYLTPQQFNERFGPTEADYQEVLRFATNNGLAVERTDPARGRLDVSAAVSDIEKAFRVTMRTYRHPTEGREFYAPDAEPTVDANLPILSVAGLNNYVRPTPLAHPRPTPVPGIGPPCTGSASNGCYWGYDFRNAYAHGVTLKGAGQYVGLVEKDGYYFSDIRTYETNAGLPNVPITNVLTDGYSGAPDNDTNSVMECSLDIELVISMAPGLAKLYVFFGSNSDDILGSMVTNYQVKQFGCCWGLSYDTKSEDYFQQMGAQGQTFFVGSGDGDAYTQPTMWPSDDPYVTSVGGTELVMDATASNYVSESVWNSGFQKPGWGNGDWTNNGVVGGFWGSGGGVSTRYSIPIWQQSVNATSVGGSSTMRNIPDVALTGDNAWACYFDGIQGDTMGTSLAAPLWAGFTALVNEQAANEGLPSVGFLNPAFYAIAQSSLDTDAFHDITNGNNFWPGSPSEYSSAPGYDLCTGWGTPNGQAMMDALVGYVGPIWVNFSGPCPGNGTYTNPFCALASATNAVANGGTICLIGPNSSSVTPTLTKPMNLRAFYGPVSIGH